MTNEWSRKKSHKYQDAFKSTLERSLKESVLVEYEYEPAGSKVTYSIPHTYNPDFVHPNSPNILIEVKGYFIKGQQDTAKYLSIIRDNPNKELVFLFSNPDKKAYSGLRPRADGTYMSLAEWCYKCRVLFFTEKTFPTELVTGDWSLEQLREYKKQIYG